MRNHLRLDPSRTTLLRKKFMIEIRKRFRWLISEIRKLIVEDDAFGLKKSSSLVFHTEYQIWRFARDKDKVKEFQKWLKNKIDEGVLEVSGDYVKGKPWTAKYIESAYIRGMKNAYNKVSPQLDKPLSFYKGTEAQFISSSFNLPETMSKVELLYTRAFTDLEGITQAMSSKMSGILTEGLLRGDDVDDIAKNLAESANLPLARAETIARTEVIRAHAEGQLDALKELGVEEVGIMAEWSTAGDDVVCVLGGNSKVLTKEGLKKIKDIKVGELVLTHKNRYKKVLKTFQRKTDEEVVQITLSGMLNNNKRVLTVTSNHPIRIMRDNKELWVQAGELKETDLICYFARKCPVCNIKMPIGNKFCSSKCAIKLGNKKRWADPEQHKKASEKNKKEQRWKNMQAGLQEKRKDEEWVKEFKKNAKKAAIKSYKEHPTHYDNIVKSNKEKGKRDNWGWKNAEKRNKDIKKAHSVLSQNHLGATWIEKKVGWWLRKINVKHESTKFLYLDNKRRWVDFFLPEYNLIIECDGEYWHQDKGKDRIKDEIAKNNGFTTLRLKEKDIRNNFKLVIEQINLAIHNGCFVNIPIKNLKKWKLKKNQPVYNLEVEEDNSYVVNYIVVHNCEECEPLEGVIFSVEEAHGMIPRHPNCRCTFIPVLKEQKESYQKWEKSEIQKAIEASISAEGDESKWAGQSFLES